MVMQEIHDGNCENHVRPIPRPQSHQPGVSLAQDVQRCRIREEIPTLPNFFFFLKEAEHEAPYITESTILHTKGTGCSGPNSPSTASVLISNGKN